MQLNRRGFLIAAGLAALAGCSASSSDRGLASASPRPTTVPSPPPSPTPSPTPTRGTPEEILARSSVPVLCYHQVREHTASDGDYARAFTTPPGAFAAQLRALKDAGYVGVSGDAVVDFLEFGAPALPEQPVLLTFDDGHISHYTAVLPALRELGWVGTFFPMTVVLNKRDWVTHDNLREMAAAGMTIGTHSWDHQRFDKLPADQWGTQAAQPREELSAILGHEVTLLAYPYGAWNQEALPHVIEAGYRAAFQLSDHPQDPANPLLTIRRIMPSPAWDGPTLLARLESEFPRA